MPLSTLTAISPLDGRYGAKTEKLRSIVSEYGLIFYRLSIEIDWLIALSENAQIKEVKKLSPAEQTFLKKILKSFNEKEAEHIKKIEQKTNHDVKAVEYYLREKLEKHASLKRLSPFIHFACTSEDINNLAYGLMLKDIREKVLIPQLLNVAEKLKELIASSADCVMLAKTHGQNAH